MRVALALLFGVHAQRLISNEDYLRVADPCQPNKCTPPQICIRMKCDSGMCAQCTMTTFSTNPEDDLPGFGPAPSTQSMTPVPPLPQLTPRPPTPSLPLQPPVLVPRNPAPTASSPASYPYVDPPMTQNQPVSYPYVDPPVAPNQPASYPYVDPSMNPQLVSRPGSTSSTSGSLTPQLTPRTPANPTLSGIPPADPCGARASCQECTRDGMCGWDVSRCVLRCAVACVRDNSKCPVDASCSSSSCAPCISSGCVWSANMCQKSCISAPCVGTLSGCPSPITTCTARSCQDCTNAGCMWSASGCQSQCAGNLCVSQSSRCSGVPNTCPQAKSCGECTTQGCKWSMNSCASECQRNQEDNIICWDTAAMCPGACVQCNDPFPACPPGCLKCQQVGQTCNACAKAVCMDNPQASATKPCAIGLPCDMCAASGCTWSVSTGCISCQSPPCSSACAPGTGSSVFPSIPTSSCSNDGQCPALQFCNSNKCEPYAAAGTTCSLSGAPRCLPPAQCVYIGNPYKPENANLNLLYCVKPGQDTSALLSQLQQQTQAQKAQPSNTLQQPQQPPTSQPQTYDQIQQYQQQFQNQQALVPQSPAQPAVSSPCCQNRTRPGCAANLAVQECVCSLDNFCCEQMWDWGCVELATRACSIQCQPLCDGQTCGECVSAGCRWVAPIDRPGSCARSCSANAGWNCHTSSCPDPCLANPCPYGQRCSISDACAKPPCYLCSSQPDFKPGTCPSVGDCDVDYESSDCSVDSHCEGSAKCCLQPLAGGFVIQPAVRSFVAGKGKANKKSAERRAGAWCQQRCMLPNVLCDDNDDCALGQYCSNSECIDFLEEGMACSTRLRCRSPLICNQGSCQRPDLMTPAVQSPASCRGDDECGSGLFCQQQARGGVCQSLRTDGLGCGEAQPPNGLAWKCVAPLVCLAEGVCRPPDYCQTNSECPQSAECINHKCTPIRKSCCEENIGAMGCADAAVEACVCATDSSCCSVAWDKSCAKTAEQKCGAVCKSAALWVAPGFGVNPCCGLQKIGGCGDIAVDGNCACKIDNFCCDNTWDYKCINIASQKCGLVCP